MGLVYKLGHRTAKKWGSLQIVFSSNTIEKKQYIHYNQQILENEVTALG